MLPENMKVGLSVRISHNIDRTHERVKSTNEMLLMKGDGNYYPIERIRDHSSSSNTIKVAVVNGYLWHPHDLIWDDEPGVEDVSLKGKKETFDVNELRP